jgi:hypothetical protein
MKNALKLTALLAAFVFASARADDDKVTLTFPDLLYKNRYQSYPCQLYSEVEDNDGTLFAYVKINTDPYVVVPGNIITFREKDYVINSIQLANQKDFEEIVPNVISIEMKPLVEYEEVPNNLYPVTIKSKCGYQIVYYDPDGILHVLLPVGTKVNPFKVGKLVYLSNEGLYKITDVQDVAGLLGFPNRTLVKLERFNER